MQFDVFSPKTSVILSASATSVSVALDSYNNVIRIYNVGPDPAFIRWDTSAQAAALTDMILPAGVLEAFNKGPASTLAAITSAAASCVLYITGGVGS